MRSENYYEDLMKCGKCGGEVKELEHWGDKGICRQCGIEYEIDWTYPNGWDVPYIKANMRELKKEKSQNAKM